MLSIENGEANIVVDAKQIVVPLHLAITMIAPSGAPRVANQPIVDAILTAPANNVHRMGDVGGARVEASKDAGFVVLEFVKVGHDVHGDGAVGLQDRHDSLVLGVHRQTVVTVDVVSLVVDFRGVTGLVSLK